jgi:hypothetical protein
MAAPEFVPVSPTDTVRLPWRSPDHVPENWTLARPAEVAEGRQPKGPRLGYPGPDLGYALVLADRFRDRLHLAPGEHSEDAVAGCVAIAMRRASRFGRAPVVHDLTIAFTIWGWLDPTPPDDLVAIRRDAFAAAAHDYERRRAIVDRVPDATLALSPAEVEERYPGRWRELVGWRADALR